MAIATISPVAADPAPPPPHVLAFGDSMGLTVFDGTHIWAITGWSLVKVDPTTRQVLAQVSVGACPLDLTVVGSSIWTANDCDNTITEVDRATATVVQSINLGTPARAITSDGTNLWVATEANVGNTSRNYVYKINPSTGARLARVGVGRMPHSLVFDGSQIWVANSWDYSVTIINVTDNSTTQISGYSTIYPTDMIFDGTYIWVVGDGVAKIDPVTKTVVDSGAVADGFHLSVAKGGSYIWVTSDNGTENSSVSQLNTSVTPFVVINTFIINWRTAGVAFDGTKVWVASTYPNYLCVIDPVAGGDCKPDAPDAPTSLVATPGDGSASIAFTPGADGGVAITKYQYSIDNGSNWADAAAGTTSPVSITGLTNGTTYSIKLRAYNSVGAGAASASSVSVTPTSATAPAAPTSLVATPGDGSASIAFVAGSDGGAAITNYEYQINGGPWVALSPLDTTTPVTIPGLTNYTTYSVKLRAVNSVGEGVGSDAVSVRPPDAPPVITSALSPGRRQILVSWAAVVPARGQVQWYRVELLQGSTLRGVRFVKAADPRSVTFAGLRNATAYEVRVRARVLMSRNKSQLGLFSNAVQVTTLP